MPDYSWQDEALAIKATIGPGSSPFDCRKATCASDPVFERSIGICASAVHGDVEYRLFSKLSISGVELILHPDVAPIAIQAARQKALIATRQSLWVFMPEHLQFGLRPSM